MQGTRVVCRIFDARPGSDPPGRTLAEIQMWTRIRDALADKTLMTVESVLSHKAQIDAAGGNETVTGSALQQLKNAANGSEALVHGERRMCRHFLH